MLNLRSWWYPEFREGNQPICAQCKPIDHMISITGEPLTTVHKRLHEIFPAPANLGSAPSYEKIRYRVSKVVGKKKRDC